MDLFGPGLVDPTGIEPVFVGVNSTEVDHYLYGPIQNTRDKYKTPYSKNLREGVLYHTNIKVLTSVDTCIESVFNSFVNL